MTTPASGALSLSHIAVEVGWSATASVSMAWVFDNTKSGQQSRSLSGYYSKAWYQRNVDGNCNNGNCPNCNCNCGGNCTNCDPSPGFNCNCSARNCSAINCTNCSACAAVNCANCDARAWIQSNCNCACTYNCRITVQYTTNCSAVNCNCNCTPINCACTGY